jgi:hypothetical protein
MAPENQVASAKKVRTYLLGWQIIISGVRLDGESHLRADVGTYLSPNMSLNWSTGPPKGEPLDFLHILGPAPQFGDHPDRHRGRAGRGDRQLDDRQASIFTQSWFDLMQPARAW